MDSRLRGNDRKRAGTVALKRRPLLAAAFTMVELLVALMVLILLLGITAVIYKSSSDAMTQTNASVAMYQDVNALTRQIDQVMKGIYTDGYLVIYGYDVRQETDHIVERTPDGKILFDGNDLPNVRSDAICFFTTGSFNSLTNQAIAANSGWVYLGHAGAVTPDTYGSSPFTPANPSDTNPLVVNQWVLSRYMLLFTPGQPWTVGDDYRDTSLGAYSTLVQKDLRANYFNEETKVWDLAGVRDWFFSNWIYDLSLPAPDQYWYTPPVVNFDVGYTFPYTLGNCGSFKIEFVMPSTFLGTNNSLYPATRTQVRLNSEPETYEADGSLVWRSAINRNPTLGSEVSNGLVATLTTSPHPIPGEINASTISGGRNDDADAIVVFGPRDTWPLMIRFTLRKYDENLSITSEEDFGGGVIKQHGGQTFEYVYKLPPKN